ncbi:hypothetical protein PoB_005693100 [Plakobranchus ocellatus]|uniref:Uncharacterized protein n=1 Tax=Plakobranchus ocellatus TaxID=259542 RepID=A0AAV4CCF5_9GAST|nr:hypothetical protein PoB_005693100 [Plakobranchus ocellatus]
MERGNVAHCASSPGFRCSDEIPDYSPFKLSRSPVSDALMRFQTIHCASSPGFRCYDEIPDYSLYKLARSPML